MEGQIVLQTVVKHEAFALRRQRERHSPLTDDGELGDRPTPPAITHDQAERLEQLRQGAEALAELKPHEVQALLLRAEGYSYREICERTGWPDNSSYRNILAWCWEMDDGRYLTVINFSGAASQCLVRVPWEDLRERSWKLADVLSGDAYERNGDEMVEVGLYVDRPAWGYHLFKLSEWQPAGGNQK